ncbi:MAG: dTDP-4-dehydrorhamnose reductase [Pseudomonadota bacterium]
MILVFGHSGQVATELQRQAKVVTLARADVDLTDPAACAAAIQAAKPHAVINAAAYTAVDRAEEEEGLATIINGGAPTAMARACADMQIPFIHISTDYVFAGSGDQPWQSDDPVGPLGAYGRSKLAGEKGITSAGGISAILRTSWVFSAHGNNFVKTMLRLGAERDKLTIVADQIGGPTPAAGIAASCLQIAAHLAQNPEASGIYHYAGAPDASWADFAREIFKQNGIVCDVEDIPTAAYPTPAMRPLNSRMDCSSLQQVFGIERPDWRAALKDVLKDLGHE